MLVEALVNQLLQRFQHEKRARFCFWFDERQEFEPLLGSIQNDLGVTDPPLHLLEYNAEQEHGQIWLKREIHRLLQATEPDARARLRFVLYLPVSEEAPLDLLAEYRIAGVVWRIGGKRPTLFSFLRQAGAVLPDSPSEQRKLYEGGRDSVLAKYVTKFIDRPEDFWADHLTADIAQSRLIGDLDRTILDLAIDPEAAWKQLRDKGLDREFLAMVRERYGFDESPDAPADWVREFVTVLALTETYLGYHEPPDFPFAARLPLLPLRSHHIQFLQRWLRDSESRPAWDRWISEVETGFDLTDWAKKRDGLCFGFPHLVRLRWRQVWSAFEEAAAKASSTTAFCQRHGALLQKEAEYARASQSPAGAWELLRDLDAFLKACDKAGRGAASAEDVASLARVYCENALDVEQQHVRIRYSAEEQGLETVRRVADRAYAGYTNTLNGRFFQRLAAGRSAAIPGMEPVTPRLELSIWRASGKRAVVVVDALRYDCAAAIGELLREQRVEIEPLVAMLPTVTPIGMTALLPLSGAQVGLQIKGNGVHPTLNGKDASIHSNRRAFLEEFGADCRDIADIEAASSAMEGLGELLVVFGHEEVDHIGHGDAQTLIRHVHLEIERLARLIRKLHRWGYPAVHVVTDHGFVLLDEEALPEEVHCEKSWCHVYKERFALVPTAADIPLTTFPFAWDPSVKVAVPPGLSFFKAEKSFSHGGAALQELIIPHLTSRSQVTQTKRIGVEVVLPTYELMRTAVKVVLRPVSAGAQGEQLVLFAETGRTLVVDVLRAGAERRSVLASGPKELRLEPGKVEQGVTLFFHTAQTFQKGELLELDIRDSETAEQFPRGGIKLTAGRDM